MSLESSINSDSPLNSRVKADVLTFKQVASGIDRQSHYGKVQRCRHHVSVFGNVSSFLENTDYLIRLLYYL